MQPARQPAAQIRVDFYITHAYSGRVYPHPSLHAKEKARTAREEEEDKTMSSR